MAEEEKENKGKEEEQNGWSKSKTQLVALTALFLAVCATFASLKSAGCNNKAILSQTQAADMWAYFQAKSLKKNLYQIEVDALLWENLAENEKKHEVLQGYKKRIERYGKEEKEIIEKAKALEADRDLNLKLKASFSNSVTYLQIAIMLSSLAVLIKQLFFWYFSLGLGAVGGYYFFSTLLLMENAIPY